MIRAVTVINHLGDSLRMELGNPQANGFLITSITGLGPGYASVNMTESSVKDGATFDSARLPSRNIVIAVEYLWDPTIEDSRQKTYKYFPIKKPVTLIFETDNRTCYISGYIEGNEPDIFRSDSKGQISILCEDPYFYAYDTVTSGVMTTMLASLEPLFEFPFENASPTTPLLEFGRYNNINEGNIIYNGDAEVGVIITLRASGIIENITIANVTGATQQVIKIDTARIKTLTGSSIVEGDIITINTIKDNKSVTLFRDGETFNILSALGKDSDWINLYKGDNLFIYTADSGAEYISLTVENTIRYAGI